MSPPGAHLPAPLQPRGRLGGRHPRLTPSGTAIFPPCGDVWGKAQPESGEDSSPSPLVKRTLEGSTLTPYLCLNA